MKRENAEFDYNEHIMGIRGVVSLDEEDERISWKGIGNRLWSGTYVEKYRLLLQGKEYYESITIVKESSKK